MDEHISSFYYSNIFGRTLAILFTAEDNGRKRMVFGQITRNLGLYTPIFEFYHIINE